MSHNCGCFLLTFRVGFFSVLGVAGMEMERRLTPRGSAPSQPLVCCFCFLSACSSRGCFFFLPRRASCYIHESLCDRLPFLPALVSRRSHPGRFDWWRLNDPQEVVSAFTLPLAVPNVSMYQQVWSGDSWQTWSWPVIQPTWVFGWKGCEVGLLAYPSWQDLFWIVVSRRVAGVLQGGKEQQTHHDHSLHAAILAILSEPETISSLSKKGKEQQ